MSWWSALLGLTNFVNKGMDIVGQLITDKEKAAELKAAFYYMTIQQYSTEAITPKVVTGVSGATSIYTIVKGKRK